MNYRLLSEIGRSTSTVSSREYNPEYTAKRLEELRLKRAESAAESFSDYKARRDARENKAPTMTADYADYSSTRYGLELFNNLLCSRKKFCQK